MFLFRLNATTYTRKRTHTKHCPTKMVWIELCPLLCKHKYSRNHIAIPLKAHSSHLGVFVACDAQTFILFSLCWNADVFDTFWTPTIHYMMYSSQWWMNFFAQIQVDRDDVGRFTCLTKHRQRQTTRITTTTNKLIKQALTLQFGQLVSPFG